MQFKTLMVSLSTPGYKYTTDSQAPDVIFYNRNIYP